MCVCVCVSIDGVNNSQHRGEKGQYMRCGTCVRQDLGIQIVGQWMEGGGKVLDPLIKLDLCVCVCVCRRAGVLIVNKGGVCARMFQITSLFLLVSIFWKCRSATDA